MYFLEQSLRVLVCFLLVWLQHNHFYLVWLQSFLSHTPRTHGFFSVLPFKNFYWVPPRNFTCWRRLEFYLSSTLSFYVVLIFPQPFFCCVMQNWYLCSCHVLPGIGGTLETWFLNGVEGQESQVLILVHLMNNCEILCQTSYFLVFSPVRKNPQLSLLRYHTYAHRQP